MASTPAVPFFDQARNDFLAAALNKICIVAAKKVSKKIPSKTLRRTLGISVVENTGILFLQHYWAIYIHDGRGKVRPKQATWLVWFANPKNDPRLSSGYPVRLSQVRRLTRDEWREGLRRNRERAAKGQDPYMIVAKVSGPAKGTPFFEDLRLEQEASEVVVPMLDSFMRFIARSETETARIVL